MHARSNCLTWLLTGTLVLAMNVGARAQTADFGPEVPHADPASPLPIGHDRMEKGGFFVSTSFLYYRQTNPLKNQAVAVRGFQDTDGSIQLLRNALFGTTEPIVPGRFFGSRIQALNTDQVSGPVSYQPGMGLSLGWRFEDGVSIEFNWKHLWDAKYTAVASLAPPNGAYGGQLADTYLFSPVFNFPAEFSGPSDKVVLSNTLGTGSASASASTTIIGGSFIGGTTPAANFSLFTAQASASAQGGLTAPFAAYGVWNAASLMTLSFVQRNDMFDLMGRIPYYQDDCSRYYALVGGRTVQFWERFAWTTTDYPIVPVTATSTATINNSPIITVQNGQIIIQSPSISVTASAPTAPPGTQPSPQDVATYSNIVSNRMYGPMIGCGGEYWLGHGFSFTLDLRAGLLVDFVKERAKYERGDQYIARGRSRNEYAIVPELDAMAAVMWYPIEGVSMRVGYDAMSFFNTISSPRPVDFNYGAVAPAWEKNTFRLIDGIQAGIGIVF